MGHLHRYQKVLQFTRFCRYHRIPLVLGIMATIAVFVLWQQLLRHEQLYIQKLVQQEAIAIETELSQELSTRILALEHMAHRWQMSGGIPKAFWEADAANYIEDFSGYQAIEWVDPSFQMQWVVPLKGNEAAQNLDLSQESRRQTTLSIAHDLRQTILTRSISLVQGGQGFWAAVPLFVEDPANAVDRFDGFILGVFRFQLLFDSILKTLPWYQVQIYDHNGLIYSQGKASTSRHSQPVTVQAYSTNWQIQVLPTPALIAAEQSSLPTLILGGGLVTAWAFAFIIYQSQQSARQARQTQTINQHLQDEITHRQAAEANLRLSEERWKLAVHGSNDGVWDWNVQTNEVFFSKQWKAMLGFEEHEISNHFEEWFKRVHPDDMAEVTETVLAHFAQQTPFYVAEHRVQCKDGFYKWVLARGQALWDEAGNVVRMVGFHTEITARKQAELALQESETKYRHLIESLNTGFVVHAPDTHILQCNATACELLGLSVEQILGKVAIDPAWHFVREDGTVMPVEEYPVNRVLSTQMPVENYVLGIKRGSQSRVWVLVTAFPEFDTAHQLKQVVVTFIDISPLKRAETELRETAAVMENAISGISKLDTQGRYLYVNKAYADITGHQPEEMIGMGWQQTVHPHDLEQVQDAYQQMLRDGKVEVEAQGMRKDGTCFYKQLVMITAYDEQQQFVGHYCFLKDINERKQAEVALQNSQARFAGILEIANDAIISVNTDQQIILFNKGAEQIFGYDAHEVVGQPLTLLMPDRFAQIHQQHVAQYAQSDSNARPMTQRGAIVGRRKDGTEFPAEASVSKLDCNGVITFTTFLRDITARQQSEAAMAHLAAIVESSEDAIISKSLDGMITSWNTGATRIFGYTATEMIGQPVTLLIPENKLEEETQILERIRQGEHIDHYDTQRRKKDGTLIDLSISISSIKDTSGKVIGVSKIARDIRERVRMEAERQQAEEDLRQSEVTKQAIIQAIPDLLMRVRSDGSYVEFISTSNFNIIEPDQIRQNATLYTALPPDLAHLRLHHIQQTLQSNTPQVYEQQIVIEGKQCYEEVRIVPLLQDEVLVMVRDITDRQQAEEDLRHQKEMFQAIVAHIPVMIALFNAQGRIEFINPELEQVLGWSLQDWQQRDILTSCYPAPVQRQSVVNHMLAATGQWKDFKTLNAHGQILETSWAKVPLSNGYFLGIGQDISDRKHKEVALQDAMKAAEAANLAKSMFLANMSHELRTPLNVILGFAQVMAHDSTLTPSQKEDLQTIRRSGDHLLNLINDVLDLSKVEAGHSILKEAGFDLISLLHTLRTMMTERATSKHLQLIFDIAPEVPQFVIADEQKLRQVLLNLLSNAIKFTHQGKVMLRVTSQESQDKSCIALCTSQNASKRKTLAPSPACMLQFEVIDTGVGITTQELETIFDAFVQAEAGRQSLAGTGLGLTISRRLLDLMNGTIAVHSLPNIGSTFTVTISVCPTSGLEIQPEQSDRIVIGLAPGQPHRRILVVDDQSENRLLMVRLLTQLGLEVREAINGEEAIRLWQNWQPHLTWMDIRMPGVDGYEATKQIRAMEREETSIIIALTAQASHSDRALALAAGCNDYISKPFREETIFLKLSEHLGLEYVYAEATSSTQASLAHSSVEYCSEVFASTHPTLPDLSTLPPEWLRKLEEAAICCDDSTIAALVEQLPPELIQFKADLTDLANQFQFEQILDLLYSQFPHLDFLN